MSPSRDEVSENEADFHEKYNDLRVRYEQQYKELIRKNDARYVGGDADAETPLEAQLRDYFLNPFLRALNWRLDATAEEGAPNLFQEARVRSAARGTRRRLDYLGIERETERPLMIVEAKNPESDLPKLRKSSSDQAFEHPQRYLPQTSSAYSKVVAAGLTGADLMLDWNDWLSDLRDYVKSVWQQSCLVPARVIVTNGRWLILFIDPDNSFLHSEEPDHKVDDKKIIVFQYDESQGLDEFATRSKDMFDLLEYRRVIGDAPTITAAVIGFYITGEHAQGAMHGLWIRYSEDPDKMRSGPSPRIRVQPVVFIRLDNCGWLRVESGSESFFEVPNDYTRLSEHLRSVRAAATGLLQRINNSLGTALTPDELKKHYQDVSSFNVLPGVKKLASYSYFHDYLLVTGEHTHFLRTEPIVANCPYHQWSRSYGEGCAEPSTRPISIPSVDDRSFFVDTQDHHCTHSHVVQIKRHPAVDAGFRRLRSGNPHGRFCEIWDFEQHVCCRACVFEEVCAGERVFSLPCNKPNVESD